MPGAFFYLILVRRFKRFKRYKAKLTWFCVFGKGVTPCWPYLEPKRHYKFGRPIKKTKKVGFVFANFSIGQIAR